MCDESIDGSAFVDERAQQVPELEDARRVEAVHRLVQDEQLRIGEQAARDAEALAHPHRVRAHAVAGAMGEPDALDRRLDPRKCLAPARSGDHGEVLTPAQVPVEARLLDDRADTCERLRAPLRDGQAAQAHRPVVRHA